MYYVLIQPQCLEAFVCFSAAGRINPTTQWRPLVATRVLAKQWDSQRTQRQMKVRICDVLACRIDSLAWKDWFQNVSHIFTYGGFLKWGYPKNGWFIWEILLKDRWFGVPMGTPIWGNLHMNGTQFCLHSRRLSGPGYRAYRDNGDVVLRYKLARIIVNTTFEDQLQTQPGG